MIRILVVILVLFQFIYCGCETKPRVDAVTVAQLYKLSQDGSEFFLLDVRSSSEYRVKHLKFTDALIPHTEVTEHLDLLPEDKSAAIYCFCHSGTRSKVATRDLRQAGYENVHNVTGGMIAWQKSGYAVENQD